MKIGLFFGSFNPIHVGHLIIANYMAQHSDLEQVWLVVSPHNPLKDKKTLARDRDRLNMIELAIEHNTRLRASNIEFKLPQPSYTVDTLAYLAEQYPQHEFALIMGGDNLASLHKWKNYEVILARHLIYVYARPEYALGDLATHPNVRLLHDVPQMQISATFIRESIVAKKSIQYLVPDKVLRYIEDGALYK
jgi:nicotinate-nucleotide adenylyltransferase